MVSANPLIGCSFHLFTGEIDVIQMKFAVLRVWLVISPNLVALLFMNLLVEQLLGHF